VTASGECICGYWWLP